MLTLRNLKSPKGANKNTKRIGRGQGSGQGNQAGKGHKGQKARKSGHVRAGFESGAMPLYIKLPKRGFKNQPHKVDYAVINLSQLSERFEGVEVTRENLVAQGLLKGINKTLPLKILGTGELKKKGLVFKGIGKFSKTAQDAIASANGKIE